MIIEFMEPIFLDNLTKEDIRSITNATREKMLVKIEQLNEETK